MHFWLFFRCANKDLQQRREKKDKSINVFSFRDAVQMLHMSARAALGSRALQCEKLLLRREA